MVRVLALVEGPTERNFCQQILAPALALRNVALGARVVGIPGHKGGIGAWLRAKREILEQYPTCEDINDDPQNAPSKRILRIAAGYRKPVDGIIAAQCIGLDRMRKACPHFGEWLGRLEQLGDK